MTRDYSTHDTRESRRVAPRALRSRRIVHVAPHSDRSLSLRESLNPKRKTGGVPGPASRRPRRASARHTLPRVEMLRAVSRGLAARASATPLGGGESSARFLPARVWRPHGETMRTASADATATSSADGPAMPGWMGRPATDARADDEDEYFPARTPADDA